MCFFFFFNDTATTEIYTLSLHDALPISGRDSSRRVERQIVFQREFREDLRYWVETDRKVALRALELVEDRKSTRLNSSHANISYAVFCLKKKNKLSSIYP